MGSFYKNIKPHVEREMKKSKHKIEKGNHLAAFRHLENAHVLGQYAMNLHLKVHYQMLLWGLHQKSVKEVSGQVLRLVGTVLFTWLNRLPRGNTGGANVPAFKEMDIPEALGKVIEEAHKEG